VTSGQQQRHATPTPSAHQHHLASVVRDSPTLPKEPTIPLETQKSQFKTKIKISGAPAHQREQVVST